MNNKMTNSTKSMNKKISSDKILLDHNRRKRKNLNKKKKKRNMTVLNKKIEL